MNNNKPQKPCSLPEIGLERAQRSTTKNQVVPGAIHSLPIANRNSAHRRCHNNRRPRRPSPPYDSPSRRLLPLSFTSGLLSLAKNTHHMDQKTVSIGRKMVSKASLVPFSITHSAAVQNAKSGSAGHANRVLFGAWLRDAPIHTCSNNRIIQYSQSGTTGDYCALGHGVAVANQTSST